MDVRRIGAGGLALALTLASCDGDGGDTGETSATASGGSESGGSESGGEVDFGDKTCALAVTLSGDIDTSITAAVDPACATLLASGPEFEVIYVFLDGPLTRFDLEVEGIDRGQTGAAMTATVTLDAADERRYRATGCTVSVSENLANGNNDDFSDGYLVTGSGSCGAATPIGDTVGESVEIGAFHFVVDVPWVKPSGG